MKLLNIYENIGVVPTIIISIAIMLFLGFAMTRLTKLLKLPNVTAYIIVGLIIGPFALNLVPSNVVEGMDFLADIALAFVAFNAGEYFKISALKKNGLKVCIITLIETTVVSVLMFVLMFVILKLNLGLSLLIASIAATTSPTATLMIVKQTGAKGQFVDILLQAIAVSNLVTLLLFSITNSIASPTMEAINAWSVIKPIVINIGLILVGGLFGFLLKLLMPKSRTTDNRLIICIATLFLFCGISVLIDVSPLLGCMAMGMVYSNVTNDDKLFKQVSYFSPPIMLLFFVRSGIRCNLGALFSSTTVGSLPLIAIVGLYCVLRAISKYGGVFLGATITRSNKETRKYLGLAILPQSSVAIGLAALGARTLGGTDGEILTTLVLAVSVIFEIIGPALSKLSLTLSKSYDNLEDIVEVADKKENGEKKTQADLLIERIQKIQTELPKHEEVNEEEQAFTEASMEEYQSINHFNNRRNRRRNR